MSFSRKVAVLVDGAFFLRRYSKLFPESQQTPEKTANNLWVLAAKHLDEGDDLYRILYYDCLPLTKRVHLPISGKSLNLAQSPQSIFRLAFFEELKRLRKVAVRKGELRSSNSWILKPEVTKALISGQMEIKDLTDEHLKLDVNQKGVDMKIGLDIASLALKRQVDKIILISGDSDFVPAAKLARREGIDVVLDPMWQKINPDLFEHIDGLRSVCKKPSKE